MLDHPAQRVRTIAEPVVAKLRATAEKPLEQVKRHAVLTALLCVSLLLADDARLAPLSRFRQHDDEPRVVRQDLLHLDKGDDRSVVLRFGKFLDPAIERPGRAPETDRVGETVTHSPRVLVQDRFAARPLHDSANR